MRSIRRSLLGYLIVLIALALGAVGVLVDRFADAAIRARETAEVGRIDEAFKARRLEAQKKFDDELLREARSLGSDLQTKLSTALGLNRFRGWPEPGKGPEPGKSPEPPRPPDPPRPSVPGKAPDEEVREYLRRSAALLVQPPAPGGWAEPVTAALFANRQTNPSWVAFESPRAAVRMQVPELIRKFFEEDDHPGLYQINVMWAPPGQALRALGVVRSNRAGPDFPLDPGRFTDSAVEYLVPDDLEFPGQEPLRRVVTATGLRGRPLGAAVWLETQTYPSQPPGGKGSQPVFSPPRGRPGEWVPRPIDFGVRLFVQVARPHAELDTRLTSATEDRDEQVQSVRRESRAELAQLRARLAAIGGGSFLALVLGGWAIVGRGLRPVGKLSEAVSRVSERDFRLPHDGTDLAAELAPIHARLTQTLDLLRRAFSREKQAVADISHELRTPIAALMATLDVALRKPRSPEQYRATLEECRVISAQLGQLVERIMTLASLDAGNDRNQVSRTDAAELAAGCAAVIRPLAAANGLSVATRIDDGLDFDTDPGKLREVLMNLLHNAVEYNRPGGTIELTARRDGGAAVFEVRDTGIGMTDEVREKIFERFFRADPSRHATGVHAGLGLAIVKEYVARLCGTLTVDSTPGDGSTFRVALPAPPPEPVPDAIAEPAAATA